MASFDRQMEDFAKKAQMSVSKTIRGTSIALFRGVILASPVDTGRFRANWMISGATPATGTTDKTDKSGNSAVGQMAMFVDGERGKLEFTLSNNLPYAYGLEYGERSGQAPNGMVRVNVMRFQRILDEQARLNR